MTNEIHIAFAVDRGYLKQVAVTIASIIANASTPEALRFHILHADDDAVMSEQVALWQRPHVRSVPVENLFAEGVLENSHISVATWLRMLLPVALPDVDRLIYLDADLVVLADIAGLWNADLGDAPMGGVVDIGIYRYARRGDARRDYFYRDYLVSLGLDPAKPQYVNAGVLLMDLARLREIEFTRRSTEMYLERRDRLVLADQDIINGVMQGDIAHLDPRWNVLARGLSKAGERHNHYVPEWLRSDLALQYSEQWIIHYIGRHKPWGSAGVWGEEAWWRYAPQSGIEWTRPVAVPWTAGKYVKEAWLDLRAALSRAHFALRQLIGR